MICTTLRRIVSPSQHRQHPEDHAQARIAGEDHPPLIVVKEARHMEVIELLKKRGAKEQDGLGGWVENLRTGLFAARYSGGRRRPFPPVDYPAVNTWRVFLRLVLFPPTQSAIFWSEFI